MNRIFLILLLGISAGAHADIWKWVDANGDVHFVNTYKPIYTWQDESGRVFFADKPGHEDAVSVDLVWHSKGDSVEEAAQAASKKPSQGSGWAHPGETAEQRLEREKAEQYYCKRAQEIYESYLNAPRLYETDAEGEKVYLSDEQMAAKIKETEDAVSQLCR